MSNPTIAVFQFRVDLETPCPRHIEIYRGEDALIRADLYQANERVEIPAGATVRFYWQTPDMRPDNQWWTAEGEVTDGAAQVAWRPTMDSGAEGYQWFLAVEDDAPEGMAEDAADTEDGDSLVCLRACGDIAMAHGPGRANEVPLPTPVIDFATVEVLHAPWPAEIEAEAVARAEADRLLDNRVDTVSAGLATHTADSVIHVTATDKSAWNGAVEGLAGKLDKAGGTMTGTLAVPRIRLKEGSAELNVDPIEIRFDDGTGIARQKATVAGAGGAKVEVTASGVEVFRAGSQYGDPVLWPESTGRLALVSQLPAVPAVVAPSTAAADAGKAADAKGTGDALANKADTVPSATAGDFAGLNAAGNLVDSGKKATDFAAAADRSMLPYVSGTTLAPETAVYRAALNADGTFPAIIDTGIPTATAYYQFELELAVPSTVPSTITGPSGWTWIDGHRLPDPADLSGGETIYVSVRLDCTARTFLASVWRVA